MNTVDIDAARARIAKLGVQICVLFPASMLALAIILKKSFYSANAGLVGGEVSEWLGYAFIAMAIGDLIAAFVLKRRLINPNNLAGKMTPRANLFAKQLAAAYVPVLALCAAPALYGLVYYFIGGNQETFVLISVICPAAYMAVRPRESEIEAIVAKLFGTGAESDLHL